MKISSLNIKYFKFHKKIDINLESMNCLIYGENGTGKSSIYEALYSNFYYQKRLDKNLDIQEMFKNRNFLAEDLEVNITLNNTNTFNRKANTLESFPDIEINTTNDEISSPNIYFTNEKVLSKLTEENFYLTLKNTLAEHFPEIKRLVSYYSSFENINRLKKIICEDLSTTDIIQVRTEFEKRIKSANKEFKVKFEQEIIKEKINAIIRDRFDEKFEVSFQITEAKSGNSDILEFNIPIIKLKIDNFEHNSKLEHHFNEAKLKLIGVAIYFYLVKIYEERNIHDFKLLVLDDFLTSLDMSNRKLISQYILEEFKDYQKIILTHNLQFNNLIKKLIEKREEYNKWNFNFLFITEEENGLTANIKSKNKKYLEEAKTYLNAGEYQISGNFLRKEFELIAEELKQILELGKVESLNKIIELIKGYDNNSFYFKPLTLVNFIQEKVSYLKNKINDATGNEHAQVGICRAKIRDIENRMTSEDKKNQIDSLISIIKKVEFYKDINFNKASHRAKEETYKKEVQRGIELLNELNKILNDIKKEKT